MNAEGNRIRDILAIANIVNTVSDATDHQDAVRHRVCEALQIAQRLDPDDLTIIVDAVTDWIPNPHNTLDALQIRLTQDRSTGTPVERPPLDDDDIAF